MTKGIFDDELHELSRSSEAREEYTENQSDAPSSGSITNQGALPVSLTLGVYQDLEVTLDPEHGALWWAMRHRGVPNFSSSLLREIKRTHELAHQMVREKEPGEPAPVKFLVGCSNMPGVFNLGGDLGLFTHCIQGGERQKLLDYAYACVEAMYNSACGFDVPIVTIGVVEGDALGGGFEAAVSFNVLIAERGVKMGLPEVLFNTFPGMGAYSFLSRKLDATRAEKLILSGKLYLAEELYDMGLVDVLAEKGQGRAAASTFMRENARRQPMLYALNKVRQRVNGLTHEELREVTEIWVDTVMALDRGDVRKMEVLRAAQLRRVERAQAAMV